MQRDKKFILKNHKAMKKKLFWKHPELNYQEQKGEHRKATWMELFFDLFFVVSISHVSHGLREQMSWNSAINFSIMFVPIWWIWIGFTYYNERFESDGLENRFFTFLLMLPSIGLSVFARNGIDKGFFGFLMSYACARMIIMFLWLRAALYVAEFRKTGLSFVAGFAISIAITACSAFIGKPFGLCLFAFALTIDLLTPLTTIDHQKELPRFSTSKMPERFGLFVLIVLGEMVVGVVNGLAEVQQVAPPLFLEASLGVALGFGFWWIYFDCIGRYPPRAGAGWGFFWGYLHLPLVMAFAAAGAGISSALAKEALAADARQIVSSAVGCAMIAMALIKMTLRGENNEPAHDHVFSALSFLCGATACCLGWTKAAATSLSLLFSLVLLVALQTAYVAWTWFRQEHMKEKSPSSFP